MGLGLNGWNGGVENSFWEEIASSYSFHPPSRFQGLNNSFSLWQRKCPASIKVDSKFPSSQGRGHSSYRLSYTVLHSLSPR
ncbi:hypothetical protein CEXT_587071 [Caerostris extrusa]|uniref:Uncharacterized protein n=1 Tax=Caerostris extrusa TaxID=172846 RepID=A0AAV4RWJ6_CAEEX|nr:hypothetical protein CEXT_587071 [Caerostris extrusa]